MLGKLSAAIVFAALSAISAARAQPQFPDGEGRTVLQQACLGCHEPSRIIASGYSRQEWQNIVHMMRNVGAPVPSDKVALLTDYLAKNFPEKPKPAPSLIGGAAQIDIREWVVPTQGCLLYTSPSPRDGLLSRMPSSA